MVIIRPLRYYLLSLVASIGVVFVYLNYQEEIDHHHSAARSYNNGQDVLLLGENRRIVAYSLLKQIEFEGKEIVCNRNLSINQRRRYHGGGKVMWTRITGTQFYVYSMYLDARLEPYHYVRIIAMAKGDSDRKLYCQLLMDNGTLRVTQATKTKIWSNSWNQNDTHIYYNPVLISCQLPAANLTHIHLSLSKSPCHPHTIFTISPSMLQRQPTTNFTICVKPLNFPHADIAQHLLQWIAVLQALGADKFELYVDDVQGKTMDLMKRLGPIIQLHQHANIEQNDKNYHQFLWQKRRYELIAYNDCFYRNIHMSQFVVPLDIDEVIVPRSGATWAELLHDVVVADSEENIASYTVSNAYYLRHFTKFPFRNDEEVFFFRDVVRSELSAEGESGKSFVATKNTLTVFNHYALEVLRPGVKRNLFLTSDQVQMNHYKNECSIVILPECAKYLSSPVRVRDDVIFKYKRRFYERYLQLVKSLSNVQFL